MNYLIEYNDKIVGVYNTYSDAEIFILGNIQNKLFKHNVKILTFKSNSCYCTEVKNYYNINNNMIDQEINIDEKNREKANIQHELNILNFNKKKINEKINIYDNDLKLYNNFIDNKIVDIPILFKNKFNIMNNLKNNNNLNIDFYFLELDKITSDNDIYEEFEIDNDCNK